MAGSPRHTLASAAGRNADPSSIRTVHLMRARLTSLLALSVVGAAGVGCSHASPSAAPTPSAIAPAASGRTAQMKPEDTEFWTPVPRVVTPGATFGAPPSDAIVLFGG